jgi:hypothetical protein
MFKYLLAILLLSASFPSVAGQDFFLSPPFPPTAFYEQYYEVRFRVRSFLAPTFTFENLPSFFTGSDTGVVSGIPNITGTFRFTIKFAEAGTSGQEQVVISVTDSPNTAASAAQNKAVVQLIVKTALDTWIFRSGDQIKIELSAEGGVAPITWNYKNLPAGLAGDNTGVIKGSLKDVGLYSFSASCGDSKGLKAESFYTLNVQPGTLIKTNNVIDVPDRNVGVVYDLQQVAQQQIAADTAVTNALAVVAGVKAVAKEKQAAQAKTQLAFNLANSQETAAENTVAKAQKVYDDAVEVDHIAQANLNTAKNVVAIATTAVANAEANVADAKKALEEAQAAFDTASVKFNAANDAYIKAANELSQAQHDYENALAALKDAQNANNIAWNNVQSAKAALDAARNNLIEANQNVVNARNNVELATQANDDALTNLNVADAALTAAQHTLENANALVASLRGQYDSAKTSLGGANFNLVQALNNLYVAQAAKTAADKAVSLAFAEGAASLDLLKGSSTYIFKGCVEQAYPEISGTVAVSTLISSGARLNSGHILTWGDCTAKTQTVAVGDLVYFEGYIVDGVISARTVAKQ